MQAREHLELFQLEDIYWWFVGRRRLVRQLIASYAPARSCRLLDAGCGTGGTMQRVADLGEIHGCDYSEYALQFCRQRGFTLLSAASVMALPYLDTCCDVVISCDVLEHLTDDVVAIREMLRLLRPGGVLILTVPAHQFLWSEHDEALRHQRRYSARELRRQLEEAGARVEKLSPVVTVAFLPILLFRLLQRLRPKAPEEPKTDLRILPPALNSMLVGVLRIENWLLRYINLPTGTSLVAVARKA